MTGLLLSLLFALAAGQVHPILATEISGDVFQGDYPILTVEWDGPSPVAWPCGPDACWLIVTHGGYVDWNGGELAP
jgi:hypothetical protein